MTTQPGKQHDLHGSTPDTHHTALLLIDVINDFEFQRGEELFQVAFAIAPNLLDLKRRAQATGMPVIYVNDNFGRWQSNFDQVVQHCLKQECKGRPFVAQLLPSANHYSLLKPKHSAFCQTPLEILLKHLGCQRVILSGFSTNSCVLFTANDAYMRDLEIVVPQNCVAACNTEELARRRCHESPPDLNVGRRPQLYGDSGTLADDSAYYLSVEEAFSGG